MVLLKFPQNLPSSILIRKFPFCLLYKNTISSLHLCVRLLWSLSTAHVYLFTSLDFEYKGILTVHLWTMLEWNSSFLHFSNCSLHHLLLLSSNIEMWRSAESGLQRNFK